MDSEGIRLVHTLPGRVRLKASHLKGNPALAQQVHEKIRRLPGVQEVRVNPLTGSILIRLDRAKLREPEPLAPVIQALGELFPEIAALNLAGEAAFGPGYTPAAGLAGSVGALNARIANFTGGLDLRLLLPLTLLFLGLRRLVTARETPTPAWYDFLWFGFSTFLMLNRGLLDGGAQGREPLAVKDSGPAAPRPATREVRPGPTRRGRG